MLARHHPRVKPAIIGSRGSVLDVTLRGTSNAKLRVVGGEGEGAREVVTEVYGFEDDGHCVEDTPIRSCTQRGVADER